jgi:drug/metabolite transporter (DMT)-like permease
MLTNQNRQRSLHVSRQKPCVVVSKSRRQQQGLGSRAKRCIITILEIDPWNDDRALPLMVELQRQNDTTASQQQQQQQQHDDDMTTTTIRENNGQNTVSKTPLQETSTSSAAVLLLNVVAILWGTQHAVIKLIVTDNGNDPASFTLLRFGIAALLASPYTPGLPSVVFQSFQQHNFDNNNNNNNKDQPPPLPLQQQQLHLQNGGGGTGGDMVDDDLVVVSQTNSASAASMTTTTTTADALVSVDNAAIIAWRWGLEMGFWMFLGFCFQAIGLEYTTAQKSGFLLYLNVKFVPFFAALFLQRSITTATWISALTAFAGTALLACAGGSGATDGAATNAANALNVGDAWSIAAAAASAMFILRLEKASAAVPNAATLNAACLWTVTGLASLWTLWATTATTAVSLSFVAHDNNIGLKAVATLLQTVWDQVVSIGLGHPWEILYLSAVTTALANYIQTKAQAEISPERACIIYAMDPVYGAIFAAWVSCLLLLPFVVHGPHSMISKTHSIFLFHSSWESNCQVAFGAMSVLE